MKKPEDRDKKKGRDKGFKTSGSAGAGHPILLPA